MTAAQMTAIQVKPSSVYYIPFIVYGLVQPEEHARAQWAQPEKDASAHAL